MKRVFEGNMYIRPLGRGVCLGDDLIDFEDWVVEALGVQNVSAGGEDIPVRITVEYLAAQPAPVAGEGERAKEPRAGMLFKPFVPEAGYCRCRHRVKLNEDGSNPCECCNEPVLEYDDARR